MIILEGPDCGGKSTLAVRLAERYSSPITHYSAHDDIHMRMHAENGEYGTAEIIDRFHLSEPPYTMYFRHETPDYKSVDAIDNILAAGNHLVILCVPSWSSVKRLWEERIDQELIKDVNTLHGIYNWYAARAGRYKTPSIHYNYEMCSTDFIYKKIDDFFSEKSDE